MTFQNTSYPQLLSRFALTLMIGAAIGESGAVYADNTFLLQLGTSDSERQATHKWNEIKADNSDLLRGLDLHVAEISLPPGHKTSYRTQAGPLTSRSQANTICASLKIRGVNCYVVETALFGSENAADAEPANISENPSASSPFKAGRPAREEASHANDPDYVPSPVDSGPVIVSTSAPVSSGSPAELAEMPVAPAPVPSPAPAVIVPKPVASLTAQRDDDDETPAQRRLPQGFVNAHASRYVKGREPRFLDAPPESRAAANAVAPAQSPALTAAQPEPSAASSIPTPASQPAAAKPAESRGFFSRLFGSSPPQPADAQDAVGSVNVAEAVRVPLAGDASSQEPKIIPVLPEVHAVAGAPEASTAKLFWAQISYFRDEAQAFDFYRQFNAAYPQLSDGLRIRITKPFTASSVPARVSLRVGPFATTNDVGTICAVANRWKARCTVIRDLGASTAFGGRSSQQNTAFAARGTHDLYYAQLGTYRFSQDAWDAWKELRAANKRILGRLHPAVTTPAASSADGAIYRLRTGPFNSMNIASALCSRLEARGAGCVVVGDR